MDDHVSAPSPAGQPGQATIPETRLHDDLTIDPDRLEAWARAGGRLVTTTQVVARPLAEVG